MATGFDLLMQDQSLQKHWVARIAAAIIDIVIVFAPIYVLMAVLSLTDGLNWFFTAVLIGFVWFAYSAFFEYSAGATIGKMLLGLRVFAQQGRLELHNTMTRNLTKTFALFLIVDILLGLIVDTTDPRQRFTDIIAKTTVVTERLVIS